MKALVLFLIAISIMVMTQQSSSVETRVIGAIVSTFLSFFAIYYNTIDIRDSLKSINRLRREIAEAQRQIDAREQINSKFKVGKDGYESVTKEVTDRCGKKHIETYIRNTKEQ